MAKAAAKAATSNGELSIDATSFGNAILAFGPNFSVTAGTIIERVITDAGKAAQIGVKRAAARHRRTGKLDSRIASTSSGAGWEATSIVKSGGAVAHLVAGDIRAHIIPMRNKPVHLWPNHSSGFVGYFRSVSIPFHRGDPYFHRGVQTAIPRINEILRIGGEMLVTELKHILEGAPA